MSSTDYEGSVHRRYSQGRAISSEVYELWMRTFASYLPPARPLRGLDLGSGTGRFTPHLADAFGPVTGVEPSDAMRGVAAQVSAHPDVDYVDGRAEAIPTSDASMDYCLMYLSWHHVLDRTRAAHEIARVLRPGGLLLCRTQFSDLMPDLCGSDTFRPDPRPTRPCTARWPMTWPSSLPPVSSQSLD